MAGDNSYKPGEIVKVSGIYSVVHDDGKDTFEVTCVEGEHFPPTRSGKGAHYELTVNTTRRTRISMASSRAPKRVASVRFASVQLRLP
jgi:hypothetical protein